MLWRLLFARSSVPYLQKSLDACSLRQRCIAGNIANATTPGYRRVEVVFEEELRKANCRLSGEVTHPRHLRIGRPRIEEVTPKLSVSRERSLAGGINNVDIDREMAALAQNQLLFSFSSRLLALKYRAIKTSIQGKIVK